MGPHHAPEPGSAPEPPKTPDRTPRRHTDRRVRLLRAGALAVGMTVSVAVLAIFARSQATFLDDLDKAAVRNATEVTRQNPALYRALLVWQEVFAPGWVILSVSLVCLWVWRRYGMRARALWAVGTLLVAWSLGFSTKFFVHRTRPVVEDPLTIAPGYSFPSSHALNTASAGVVLTGLLWPLLDRRGRGVVFGLASAVVVLTALDRVFLGVHYPTDVVTGIALGGAIAGASFLAYVGWNPPAPGNGHQEES